MEFFKIDWDKKHILKTNTKLVFTSDEAEIQPEFLRKEVEPWLSTIFQSEHLSVLIGSGLTSAVSYAAGVSSQGMWRLDLTHEFKDKIKAKADETAIATKRGEANIEDDIRVTLELIAGLKIIDDARAFDLENELNKILKVFITAILKSETDFLKKIEDGDANGIQAFNLLKSFVLSFTSRAASRERLNIFTTNYDRFLELACDDTGVLLLDRFRGKMLPIFRNTRIELDYHYSPPGIRGEPRYVEGVARMTKIHGSLDWRFQGGRIVKALLPFGAEETHPAIPKDITDHVVIYPNSSKDVETAFYPYAELFRDFSSAVCQPNSVLITYGYGFGDSHINRVIEDMLTIPSSHLVIIAYDRYSEKDKSYGSSRERIVRFLETKNAAQCTILIGEHFGDLKNLVEYYLPKSAIDRLTVKMQRLKDNRGENAKDSDKSATSESEKE